MIENGMRPVHPGEILREPLLAATGNLRQCFGGTPASPTRGNAV